MGLITDYLKPIWNASYTIFEGMTVTLANFLRKPMTIQYPDRVERPVVESLPERYRGILEVDINKCTACRLCEGACPIQCISIKIEKNAEGQRGMTAFTINIGKCMFCGLCVEPCQTGAIRMTKEFEYSCDRLDKLNINFIPEGSFVLPVKAKQGLESQSPPKGQILKQVITQK